MKLSLVTNLKGPRWLVKRADLLLLSDNMDEATRRVHIVLMNDLLLMCELMLETENETTGLKYWLMYPPLSTKFVVIRGIEPQRERKYI